MAQDTTPAIIVYQGDGSNSVFDVPFDKGYYGEIKVLFVRRGLADYTYNPNTFTVSGRLYAWQNGGAKIYTHTPNPAIGAPTYNSSDVEQAETVSAIAGQTITVDSLVYSRAVQHDISSNMKLTWTGDMLEVGDFICIVRNTERGQPYEMPNNQKHIERALDNIERQVQEVKDATDNALKIDPSHDIPDSHKMNPVDWLKTIVRSLDLSVRGLKYSNEWVLYSTDDPNIAEADKTWVRLLNTDNIKNIRESVRYDEEHNPIYYIEYKDQNGQWKILSDAADWESRIAKCEEDVAYAVETSEDAKDVAQDAYDKVDTFDDRLTQAESDASSAKNTVDNHVQDTNNPHSVTAAQVGALPNTTKYGSALSLTINSTTYVLTAQLKDQDGNNLGTAQTIDLPLESVVVSGAYDSATKEVVLTLQDGSKIRFSVADLVSGLQTEITALNMLNADFVDDSTSAHKFVTSAEKTAWNNKQNAISDLATIRSNAQAGKTASDIIATYGNIITHNVSEFATAAQGAKADTAVQPSDLGNGTIIIRQGGITKGTFTTNQSGNTTVELDAGGGVGNIDNVTITANTDQEIQAVAVIDQNTGIAKTWTGTMAEYEAIVTKDPETEYIITDDIGGSATEMGEITEALNDKVDKGFDIIEFQEPTADNGYTWYKKYRNGWVEQGGRCNAVAYNSETKNVTFPIQMADTGYCAISCPLTDASNDGTWNISSRCAGYTTTSMTVRGGSNGNAAYTGLCVWEVKGFAA